MANTSKPAFNRQESWRYKRVKPSWRRARGVTSKIRKEEAGWPAKVKVGYGTTARTRGLHPRGLKDRVVEKLSDLDGLNPKIHIIRISRRVGERKRLVILDETRRRNFHIANPGKEAEKPIAPEEPTATEPPTQGEADAEIEQSKDAEQADEETTETQELDETESEDKDS